MDIFLDDFHFLRPLMFLALLPLFWLMYQHKKQKKGMAAWQNIMDAELLQYLQVGHSSTATRQTFWASSLAGLLMVVALAGPVWKQLPQPMYREESALVVVLDLSRSMDAADLKPSRLVRAKQKLTDLLHQHREGQTALVVFAGSAFVVTPLTDDKETILSQLQGLTSDIMPLQGGDIDSGLNKAKTLFEQAHIKHGQVLVLTDSAQYSQAVVQKMTNAGFQIQVIGVGTPGGAPIRQAQGGFWTDSSGNIVVPKLDEGRLRQLALLGQGSYQRMRLDDADLDSVLKVNLEDIWHTNAQQTQAVSDPWQEEGVWLLLLVMPLLLWHFRNGLFAVVIVFCLQPVPADAGVWQNMWQSKDKQGEVLMQQHDYAKAYQTFENPAWKASAAYQDKNYEAAWEAWQHITEPMAEDLYNKGNILAQLGRLDEAIDAYDAVLKQQPNHTDAQVNKTLVEKLKEQQKEQDKQQSQKEGKGKAGEKQKKGQQGQQEQSKQEESKQGGENQGNQGQDSSGSQGQAEDQPSQEEQQRSSQQDKEHQQAAKESARQKKDEPRQEDKQQKQVSETQQNQSNSDKETTQQEPLGQQDDMEKTEQQQAFEQTLRRIPDDPAGLLRRKFLYQYKRQQGQQPLRGEQW